MKQPDTAVRPDRSRVSRRTAFRAVSAILVGLAGCVGDSGTTPRRPTPPVVPPPAPSIALPDGEDTVWLEVEQHPGYVPIEYAIGRAPLFQLTVGRDLYFEGPTPSIFPGYLLPNLRHARLNEAAFARIHAAAAELRLSEIEAEVITDLADIVADAPTTTVIQRDRTGEHRLSVYALYFEEHTDPRVPLVHALVDALGDASNFLGSEEWRGDRLQVWVLRSEPFWDPDFATEEPWPLADPPRPDDRAECRVFEGAEAARLLAVFRPANHGYRWVHEGNHYTLVPRPLFPSEEGCEEAR